MAEMLSSCVVPSVLGEVYGCHGFAGPLETSTLPSYSRERPWETESPVLFSTLWGCTLLPRSWQIPSAGHKSLLVLGGGAV